jgi:Arc/MetJ-type ribon-helix-helix transcriptional regulator
MTKATGIMVRISPETAERVRAEVASGPYLSQSHFIRTLIEEWFARRDNATRKTVTDLRKAIADGAFDDVIADRFARLAENEGAPITTR